MDFLFYMEGVLRDLGSWAGSVRRPELGAAHAGDPGRELSLRFFAQEFPAPDAAHLSNWLVDAAALGAILLIFLKIVDHFKRRPSLEQELEKLIKQIRTELNQLRHEQSNHLSEVRGRVEGAHQRVDLLTHDLNNKLQRLPGEIVDLLHKTGVTPRGH